MLDIKLFRESPEKVKESERKRFRDTENVDKVIEYDKKWRDVLQQLNELRKQRNTVTKDISSIYKGLKKIKDKDEIKAQKEKAEELKEKSREIGNQIKAKEPIVQELEEKRDEYRYKVGNILHKDTPIFDDEENNVVLREVGRQRTFQFDAKNHVDLVETVGGVNLEKASEVVGHRFYYLKNELVRLNLALMNYALDVLQDGGYTPIWTPFFIKHEVIKEAAELADFEEQLYKIQDEDLYLIATSEQTLAALHRGEIIDENKLPIMYAGVSSCFRREAGSHGRDTLGIFRVHQFEKVEQYVFCEEEDADKMHKQLIETAEKIYKGLEIPYRIVNIVSGELNDNAAIKYDLEGWFAGQEKYRELVSCSNCTDYQARKLKIRYGTIGDNDTYRAVYTLNGTAIATERTICCILENYQNEDGSVDIPQVLIPYMNGLTKIKARKN